MAFEGVAVRTWWVRWVVGWGYCYLYICVFVVKGESGEVMRRPSQRQWLLYTYIMI